MVEMCNAERLGWMSLTILTAITAGTPRLRSSFEHGKLRAGAAASPRQEEAGPLAKLLQATVPKHFFSHFYILCVAACAMVFFDLFVYGGSLFSERIQGHSLCSKVAGRSKQALELGAESLLCLFLLTLQAARRLWECVAVTTWGSSRMSLVAYVVGILHYQLLVFTILAEAPPLGRLIEDVGYGWENAPEIWVAMSESVKLQHTAALGLFVVGSVRQHEAIVHLASLRGSTAGDGNKAATNNVYGIPTKGWFQHVSCPHYFAELLIYAAFVLLGSFKGRGLGQGYLVAFTWVFANQALVAGRAHAWYLRKFEGYPAGRKRLIPGVW